MKYKIWVKIFSGQLEFSWKFFKNSRQERLTTGLTTAILVEVQVDFYHYLSRRSNWMAPEGKKPNL